MSVLSLNKRSSNKLTLREVLKHLHLKYSCNLINKLIMEWQRRREQRRKSIPPLRVKVANGVTHQHSNRVLKWSALMKWKGSASNSLKLKLLRSRRLVHVVVKWDRLQSIHRTRYVVRVKITNSQSRGPKLKTWIGIWVPIRQGLVSYREWQSLSLKYEIINSLSPVNSL